MARDPLAGDLAVISAGIQAFNRERIGDVALEEDFRFAVFARDDRGEVAGGIRAVAFWDWLSIELLWLREDVRGAGLGSRLLAAAEAFAIENEFFRVRVETTSFQALGFYKKQGYRVFGELDDFPRGHTSYYLRKSLANESA